MVADLLLQAYWNPRGILNRFLFSFLGNTIQSPRVGACVRNVGVLCLGWTTGLSHPCVAGLPGPRCARPRLAEGLWAI